MQTCKTLYIKIDIIFVLCNVRRITCALAILIILWVRGELSYLLFGQINVIVILSGICLFASRYRSTIRMHVRKVSPIYSITTSKSPFP